VGGLEVAGAHDVAKFEPEALISLSRSSGNLLAREPTRQARRLNLPRRESKSDDGKELVGGLGPGQPGLEEEDVAERWKNGVGHAAAHGLALSGRSERAFRLLRLEPLAHRVAADAI